jgi:hypothetical protein
MLSDCERFRLQSPIAPRVDEIGRGVPGRIDKKQRGGGPRHAFYHRQGGQTQTAENAAREK